MDEKALTLSHELPRLIEAAKALEASVLVMLLTSAEEEVRKRRSEQRPEPKNAPPDPS
jgi:2-phosphoglycerate kinase